MTHPRPARVRVLLRSREPVPVAELAEAAKRGQPISRAELWSRYGPSEADVEAVAAHFSRCGVTLIPGFVAWRTVELQGALGNFVFAFPRGPDDPIPESLAGIIEWVWGLRGLGQTEPPLPESSRGLDPIPTPAPTDPRALRPEHFPPPEFVRFYGFPEQFRGAGRCVGILSLIGGYDHAELDVFFSSMGMPCPRIVDVGENRRALAPTDLWTNYEISMDLQIASSCAPEAEFVVYHSGARTGNEVDSWSYWKLFSDALFDERHRPEVLSLSSGLPENLPGFWTRREAELLDGIMAMGACLGVTLCLPTGDSGSNFATGTMMFDAPALVYFPSTSPWCLAIGSTTVDVVDGELVGERVWNRLAVHMNLYYRSNTPTPTPYHAGATTGGVSRYFSLPEWQREAGVPPIQQIDMTNWVFTNSQIFEGRGVPDVAACGDFMSGFRVYLDGRWCYGGGTCATAPFWAAMIARINQAIGRPVGFVTPILYELVLERGVVPFNRPAGGNGAFAADPQKPWNPCTGLGTPRGAELIEALREYFGQSGPELSREGRGDKLSVEGERV
jgi:kumamolisin